MSNLVTTTKSVSDTQEQGLHTVAVMGPDWVLLEVTAVRLFRPVEMTVQPAGKLQRRGDHDQQHSS